MKKKIILLIFLKLVLVNVSSSRMDRRNIGFNFFKRGIKEVEMIGNFGKGGKIVFLPMLKVSKKQWILSLSLEPGFYYFRYRLDKKHWRLCPFIDDKIVISSGPVQGKFTLLKVFPVKYKDFILLGEDFLKENKMKWARDAYLKAAKKFPDKIEIYKRLGEVYEKLGHYGFAMDAYFAGLERKPDDHQLIYYLARSYEKLYSNTGKEDYKERAKDLWIQLIEIGKYKSEAKKYLRR